VVRGFAEEHSHVTRVSRVAQPFTHHPPSTHMAKSSWSWPVRPDALAYATASSSRAEYWGMVAALSSREGLVVASVGENLHVGAREAASGGEAEGPSPRSDEGAAVTAHRAYADIQTYYLAGGAEVGDGGWGGVSRSRNREWEGTMAIGQPPTATPQRNT
jgi:hypothetical protein